MGATRTSFRYLAPLGVALTCVVALSACGSSSSGSGASGSGTPKVAAVIKGLDNPFFQSMEKGIKDQAATAKITTTIQAAQSITDTTGQADKLNALASQDYSCFVVNPITGTNLVQGIAKLAALKKTIVNIDSPVDAAAAKAANAKLATYIGTDNVAAGKLAGQQMAKLVPSSSVAVIGGTAGDVTSAARVTGFTSGIGSGAMVLPTVAANWDRQQALTAATTILQAHPDLGGFFSANDDMALGVAQAIANSGKAGKVHVISVDGIQDALKAIQAGTLDATVAQYPYAIGQMGVEACQAAAAGKSLPSSVAAPVALVTKTEADKALTAFPKPFASYDDPFAALSK